MKTKSTIPELYNLFRSSKSVCTDTRKISEGCLFFCLKGGNFDGNKFALEAVSQGALAAIVDDEEVAENDKCYLVDDVLTALQDVAAYHRDQLKIPVIGITGSNGKTTTKELLREVLATTFNTSYTLGNFNNHIGVPLTLLAIPEDAEMVIVEMGANHIGEIAALCQICKPTHGLITNIGKAHLEGFGSLEGVARGKSELYAYLLENHGVVFVNGSDEHLVRMAQRIPNSINYAQSGSKAELDLVDASSYLVINWGDKQMKTQLVGAYNFANVAAAVALGEYFKVKTENIISAIEGYSPDNNRSELINKNGINVILDAYNANPTSMEAAINNFKQLNVTNKIAVLGDMYELGSSSNEEHFRIAQLAGESGFEHVYLCGALFSEVIVDKEKVSQFRSREDLMVDLKKLDLQGKHLLIKGSRGMGLEKLVESIGEVM